MPRPRRPRLLLVGLPVFAVFAAFGAIVWLAYQHGAEVPPVGEPPLIKAPATALKLPPGGRRGRPSDGRRSGRGPRSADRHAAGGQLERLLPSPEEPLTPEVAAQTPAPTDTAAADQAPPAPTPPTASHAAGTSGSAARAGRLATDAGSFATRAGRLPPTPAPHAARAGRFATDALSFAASAGSSAAGAGLTACAGRSRASAGRAAAPDRRQAGRAAAAGAESRSSGSPPRRLRRQRRSSSRPRRPKRRWTRCSRKSPSPPAPPAPPPSSSAAAPAAAAGREPGGARHLDRRRQSGAAAGPAAPQTPPAAVRPAHPAGRPGHRDRAGPAGSAAHGAGAGAPPTSEPAPNGRVAALDGAYRIQLAAVRDEADARRAWDLFLIDLGPVLKGVQPFIERAETANGVFYRVQVGPFASLQEAESLCDQLKQRNASCFVIRR